MDSKKSRERLKFRTSVAADGVLVTVFKNARNNRSSCPRLKTTTNHRAQVRPCCYGVGQMAASPRPRRGDGGADQVG